MKHKVAYMLGGLPRGGAETLVLDVFRHAADAPFDVVGIYRKSGAYEDNFKQTGRTFIQCAPHGKCFLTYFRQLRKIFRAEHVTIVHTQQALDCIYAWLALHLTLCLNKLPKKLITTFHGFDMGENWMMKLKNSLAIWMADEICFVSKYQFNVYLHQYSILCMRYKHDSSCIHVVYNGIDFSKFKVSNAQFLSLTPQLPINLCMVGNFNHVRSQKVICQALSLLDIPITFSFIGRCVEGEEYLYDECVRLAHDVSSKTHNAIQIQFLGSRSDVPQLLAQMDGFVYSTNCDTFGIAVIEAAASGLPVLVNDNPVMKEVAEPFAFFYESDNPADCAEKIKDLIACYDNVRRRAQEQIIIVRDLYSINHHILRLNSIYNS